MNFQKSVFISHSTENAEIAKQFTSLLRNIGIPNDQIFCSSVSGQGVNNGEKLNDAIHASLKSSKLIIYILSDAFLKSNYCIEELGAGWFLTTDQGIKCYYLRLPDFEMDELTGFVNSKVDRFSVINKFDDIILLMENICDEMAINTQKASIFSNYATTFISAIRTDCQKAIEEKKKKQAEQEQGKKEFDCIKEKLKSAENLIQSYKKSIEISKAESNKRKLKNELDTIVLYFRLLGSSQVVSKDIIKQLKQFCSEIVNRYEELLKLLKIEPDDASMERIVSQFYLTCKNYSKAYQHFLNAIKLAEYMPSYQIKFFVEEYPFSIIELIQIYIQKSAIMPEGIEKDMLKQSLDYMQETEKKKTVTLQNSESL